MVAKPEDNVIGGYVPLSVKFTDRSENVTSWKWSFGDGSISSEQSPMHTYDKVGQYTVTLTVSNEAGSNAVTKYSYVSVINSLEAPVAAFSASTTLGKAPLNVSFNDMSTGSPTSWKWYFGDGTNSTEQNPMHTCSKVGQYTVSLTVSNAAGSNTVTKYGYISIANSLNAPVAGFSASAAS
jgi:PKD repeat protein